MTWSLWLDDERLALPGFYQAESIVKAQDLVTSYGPPAFMSLDHDLEGEKTSMDFIKWLSQNYFDLPPKYTVHSANPVGKENIISFMENWKRNVYRK